MAQVQIFSDSDTALLQESINEWLAKHENIKIIGTNLNSLVKPDLLGNMQSIETHVFYILFEVPKTRRKRALETMKQELPAGGDPQLQ